MWLWIRLNLCLRFQVDPPDGYLFLCPPKNFETELSSYRWPDVPFYWSLHSSGAERLSMEDAVDLGFPSLRLSTEMMATSWPASLYARLRQLHRANDFDPDSQVVAPHFGHPLYQLPTESVH
ncbi:hypothetical protein B0H19DRAFT_1382981, partial [Mycena capillaripes]